MVKFTKTTNDNEKDTPADLPLANTNKGNNNVGSITFSNGASINSAVGNNDSAPSPVDTDSTIKFANDQNLIVAVPATLGSTNNNNHIENVIINTPNCTISGNIEGSTNSNLDIKGTNGTEKLILAGKCDAINEIKNLAEVTISSTGTLNVVNLDVPHVTLEDGAKLNVTGTINPATTIEGPLFSDISDNVSPIGVTDFQDGIFD